MDAEEISHRLAAVRDLVAHEETASWVDCGLAAALAAEGCIMVNPFCCRVPKMADDEGPTPRMQPQIGGVGVSATWTPGDEIDDLNLGLNGPLGLLIIAARDGDSYRFFIHRAEGERRGSLSDLLMTLESAAHTLGPVAVEKFGPRETLDKIRESISAVRELLPAIEGQIALREGAIVEGSEPDVGNRLELQGRLEHCGRLLTRASQRLGFASDKDPAAN
jgi:hypothetical protein